MDNLRLYLLADTLYFLVVTLLLRECSVSEKTVQGVAGHRRFRDVVRQLEIVGT